MENTISYIIPGILLLWFVIGGIVIKKKVIIPETQVRLRRFRKILATR